MSNNLDWIILVIFVSWYLCKCPVMPNLNLCFWYLKLDTFVNCMSIRCTYLSGLIFFSSPSSDKAVRKELMSLIAPFYDYLMKFGNNTPLAKFTLFLENLGNLVVFTWFIFSPHLKKEAWGRNWLLWCKFVEGLSETVALMCHSVLDNCLRFQINFWVANSNDFDLAGLIFSSFNPLSLI